MPFCDNPLPINHENGQRCLLGCTSPQQNVMDFSFQMTPPGKISLGHIEEAGGAEFWRS